MIKMDSSYFTWQIWRGGIIQDLGIIRNRDFYLKDNLDILRKYAIGYCESEFLVCRPKIGYIAVMFQKGDLLFWTHISKSIFLLI